MTTKTYKNESVNSLLKTCANYADHGKNRTGHHLQISSYVLPFPYAFKSELVVMSTSKISASYLQIIHNEFFISKGRERALLAYKALEFLRQAPENTTAYSLANQLA